MLKLFFLYLKYLFAAKTKHGVHSPFVYKLLTEAISKKKDNAVFILVENCRKKLLLNNSVIEVTDLGAGSGPFNTTKRVVSEIARNSLKSKKYARLMYNLVEYFKPSTILELGTSFGITTLYMANANEKSKLISIEGSEEIASVAKKNIEKLNVNNVEVIVGPFDEKLDYCITNLQQLDFVFIDGNHRKESTLEYFNRCLISSHERTVFVFDDIRWSEGMMQAWEMIKGHKDVTVTIDLFFMGLVFIHKNQMKEHFTLKY